MLFSNYQIPPPKYWEAFEDLCCDLWREIWKDPNTKKHGRKGQEQNGVDIWGRPEQGLRLAGIQCKGKDHYSEKTLTEDEVKREIEKAKNFKPKLSEYIIATTGKKDVKIEELARNITDENLKKGWFSVNIYAWEDILGYLDNYSNVIKKHFSVLLDDAVSETQLFRFKKEIISHEDKSTEKMLSEFRNLKTDIFRKTDYSLSDVSKEYQAELDYSRSLLNDNNPNTAYKYLKDLKERIWSVSEDIIKFRILTNMGCAKLSMNQEKEAIELFFEAHQYNPDSEIALSNKAFAHLLSGEFNEAKTTAYEAISRNKANRKAYSIIIQATQQIEEIESLISKLPEFVKSSPEVALAIGTKYRNEKNLKSALEWHELAVKNDAKNIPEYKGILGELLINMALEENSLIIANELINIDRDKILRGRDFLKKAWEQISNSEMRFYRISWILGISISEALTGNNEEAISEAEEALKICPDDPGLIRHRTILAMKNGGISRGLELITKHIDSKVIPDALILQAELLRKDKQEKKAIFVLNSYIQGDPPLKLKEQASFLLTDILMAEKEFDKAKEILDLIKSFSSLKVRVNIYYSRLYRLLGEIDKGIELLDQEKPYAQKFEDLLIIASEYYFNNNFKEAASIYEKIVDPEVLSTLSIRLIESYYRSGLKGKALELCRTITKKYGPTNIVSEVECSIYEEIGDLDDARRVYTDYLDKFPNDFNMRLRMAVVNFRDNHNKEVDEFLKLKINFEDLSTRNGLILSELYSRRNLRKESLKLLYELRRKYFSESEIHLSYITNFLSRDESVEELLNIQEIGFNSAVLVEDKSGQSDWFILEDRKDIEISKKEIGVSHPIFKALISKKEGDEVLISTAPFSKGKRKIKRHISKFVFAFQESLSKFNILFPSDKSIQMIEVEEKEKIGDLPPELKKFLEFVGEQSRNHARILDFYKGINLTIGSVAKLLGRNAIDVWGLLASDYNLGVRCCSGDISEQTEALKFLNKNGIKLIIDIISILTLFEIGYENKIIEFYGKLGMAQSTIDYIKSEVDYRKSIGLKSNSSIGKLGDKYIISETSLENAQKTIKHLEGILTWINENCDVIPCRASLHIEEEKRNRLYNFYEKLFIDTIFVAMETGNMLYSDDLLLRIFAKRKYNVDGLWTQILLIQSRNKKLISRDEYSNFVMKLASLFYFHTSIDQQVLIKAAECSNWNAKSPYTNVLHLLSEGHANEESALSVTVDFLFSLYSTPIIDFLRENMVYALLDKLLLGRNRKVVLNKLKKNIKNRHLLFTFEPVRIIKTIKHWESTHII